MFKLILKILGGVILVLSIVAYFSYDYWLEKELKYQLSEIISKDPNSLYEYSFSKLDIHLMEGSVDLKGISIKPRTGAFDSLSSETNGVRFLLHLEMEEIELVGFEIYKFIRTGSIDVKSLIINAPTFNYYFVPGKKQAAQAMPLNNIFSENFKEADLGMFIINDARIEIIDNTKAAPAIIINHIKFELKKAHMDSITLQRFSPFDYDDIKVKAAGINVDISEDFAINSDSLIFEVEEETFTIKNFQINPKLSQEAFANKYNIQKEWFAITLDSLIINQIDFDELVETGLINIGKIEVISPNVGLYKDKRKETPPFKKKLLPASAIKSISWPIIIDTVMIENALLTINETSAHSGQKSNLTFNSLNAMLLNFTNDSSKLSESHFMTLSASTMAMNRVMTSVNMSFDLTSSIDEFMGSGNVGSIDATAFNPVLEPMMGVKVTDGIINNLEFNFVATDSLSIGTLDIDYEGIKLEVFNTDNDENKKSKKGFLSFAANTVVKTHNRSGDSNYLQGVIHITRVYEKDVWPYLWHSIQAGLVSTLVPITNSKEAKKQQKQLKQELRKENKANKR